MGIVPVEIGQRVLTAWDRGRETETLGQGMNRRLSGVRSLLRDRLNRCTYGTMYQFIYVSMYL